MNLGKTILQKMRPGVHVRAGEKTCTWTACFPGIFLDGGLVRNWRSACSHGIYDDIAAGHKYCHQCGGRIIRVDSPASGRIPPEKSGSGRHIELLGFFATDAVTGFHGIIDSVCFDLYGCVQAAIKPKVDGSGNIPDSHWFDITRLIIDTSGGRKLKLPDFDKGYVAEGRKGPADKPAGRA